MIQEWIIKWVARLGVWGCVCLGTVLFYEGVPFLNWWPVNQTPYIGKVIEGEISRRIKPAVAANELKWRTALQRAQQESDAAAKAREIELHNKEAAFRAERVKAEEYESLVNDVRERAIELERQKNDALELSTGRKVCRPLDELVPADVLRAID